MAIRHLVHKRIVYVLLLYLLFFLTSVVHAQPILIFAQIEDVPDQIVIAKILTVAYSKIGIPISFITLPAKRALTESSHGRLDGEIYRIDGMHDSYPHLIRVPTSIYSIESSIFTKRKNMNIRDCYAIKNLSVGIIRGVKHSELCAAGLKNVHVFSYAKTMMKMLNAGKIDIALISKNNGIILLKQLNIDDVQVLNLPLKAIPVYHYLNKKHMEVVAKIDLVLTQMIASGELEQIKQEALFELFKHYE